MTGQRGHGRGRLWRLETTPVREGGAVILLLEGRIGHAGAPELDAAARSLLSSADLNELVLDLSRVDYLSSAALEVIDAVAHDVRARGGRVTIRAASAPARLALDLAGTLAEGAEPPE
jgi:anti-anti-sigma factor